MKGERNCVWQHSVLTKRFPSEEWESRRGSTWPVSRSVVSDLCGSMNYRLPGSSVQGVSQARILGWVAISSSRESSQPRDRTQVSCTAGGLFTDCATREDLLYIHRGFEQFNELMTMREPGFSPRKWEFTNQQG